MKCIVQSNLTSEESNGVVFTDCLEATYELAAGNECKIFIDESTVNLYLVKTLFKALDSMGLSNNVTVIFLTSDFPELDILENKPPTNPDEIKQVLLDIISNSGDFDGKNDLLENIETLAQQISRCRVEALLANEHIRNAVAQMGFETKQYILTPELARIFYDFVIYEITGTHRLASDELRELTATDKRIISMEPMDTQTMHVVSQLDGI